MPAHFAAWRGTLARHGIDFGVEGFYALAGCPTDRIIETLAGERGLTLDVPRVADEKERAFLEALATIEAIGPVADIVRGARGKLPMAVATGAIRPVLDLTLRQIGFEGWFDAIVTAEDTERHKPEPDVFLEAARRLGVRPEGCLVYEDSDFGVEAARRAGMNWVDIRELPAPRPVG
jgi:beta-phosphoglucomutase-like phosphatase (HAD superfamily)